MCHAANRIRVCVKVTGHISRYYCFSGWIALIDPCGIQKRKEPSAPDIELYSYDTIFVCEAAMDAISLMKLYAGGEPGCAYASIGGAGCTAAIQRISRTYPDARIIVAFDNDKAGHDAADKLPYETQFPVYKDWNEDLTRGIAY